MWMGAIGTALLFTGGKYLLSLYLSTRSMPRLTGPEVPVASSRWEPSKYAVLVDESKATAHAANAPSPHRA